MLSRWHSTTQHSSLSRPPNQTTSAPSQQFLQAFLPPKCLCMLSFRTILRAIVAASLAYYRTVLFSHANYCFTFRWLDTHQGWKPRWYSTIICIASSCIVCQPCTSISTQDNVSLFEYKYLCAVHAVGHIIQHFCHRKNSSIISRLSR